MSGKDFFVTVIVIGILILLGINLCSKPPEPPKTPPPTKEKLEEIGEIAMQRNRVWHTIVGQGKEEMTRIDVSEALFSGDTVNIQESGKALLTFEDLEVYALAQTEFITTEGSKNNPNIINLLLHFGGVIGRNQDKDKTLQINLGNGVKVTVSGTEMFLIYDDEYDLTWVGNFDGHVQVEAGSEALDLPGGQMTATEGNQLPENPIDLYFSLEDLLNAADDGNTPVTIMRGELPNIYPDLYPPNGAVTAPPTEEAAAEEAPTEQP